MSTTWTRTAQQICTDALQHLSVLGAGETATSADMQKALTALDTVLKELPLAGFTWPQLSGEVALTWASLQTVSLPADYYGYPVVWKTLNGFKSELQQIPHAAWVQMPDRTVTGSAVTHFYISPANVLYVYPTPAIDPVLTLQYQKIVPDASATSSTALPQFWNGALGWGVASEMSLDFGVPAATRVEIAQRWKAKMERALASSIGHETISFSVQE